MSSDKAHGEKEEKKATENGNNGINDTQSYIHHTLFYLNENILTPIPSHMPHDIFAHMHAGMDGIFVYEYIYFPIVYIFAKQNPTWRHSAMGTAGCFESRKKPYRAHHLDGVDIVLGDKYRV